MAVMITEPYHCTFIHIPKTGGNSVMSWMDANFTTRKTKGKQHGYAFQAEQMFGDLGTKFCIVRNPWDWCVSWYHFRLKMAEQYIQAITKHPNRYIGKRGDLQRWQDLKSYLDLGFENWVTNVNRKPQSKWAHECDIVLKLENINEDFKIIQEKLDCFEPIEKLNTSNRKTDYKEYYTDTTINIVAEKYKQDIENFNYGY